MTQPQIFGKFIAAGKLFGERGLAKKKSPLGFNARGIDDLLELASEVFIEVGIVSVTCMTMTNNGVITTPTDKKTYSGDYELCVTFFAEDGSSISASAAGNFIGSDPSKTAGQASSYLYKEILFKTFTVPTSGNSDPDFDKPEEASQVAQKKASAPQPSNGNVSALY